MNCDEPDILDVCVLQDRVENTDIYLNSEEWFFILKFAIEITWKFEDKQIILKRDGRGFWVSKSKLLGNSQLHIGRNEKFTFEKLQEIKEKYERFN